MNKNIGMMVTFVAGIVIGVSATYRIASQKYNNIANEEIQSVIDRFSNRQPIDDAQDIVEASDEEASNMEKVVEKKQSRPINTKNDILEYKNNVARIGYDKVDKKPEKPTKATKNTNKKKGETVKEMTPEKKEDDLIYIITPDEFNTLDGFKTATLYYSSDNYVIDSDYEPLSDTEIVNKIGHDPLGHFGEYEDDSVYIRNEELMYDFEILLSMKTCAEIRG